MYFFNFRNKSIKYSYSTCAQCSGLRHNQNTHHSESFTGNFHFDSCLSLINAVTMFLCFTEGKVRVDYQKAGRKTEER